MLKFSLSPVEDGSVNVKDFQDGKINKYEGSEKNHRMNINFSKKEKKNLA